MNLLTKPIYAFALALLLALSPLAHELVHADEHGTGAQLTGECGYCNSIDDSGAEPTTLILGAAPVQNDILSPISVPDVKGVHSFLPPARGPPAFPA